MKSTAQTAARATCPSALQRAFRRMLAARNALAAALPANPEHGR